MVTHCFTTRIGGNSSGECESLNFGFNKKDQKENVLENFKKITESIGIDYKNLVFSNQIHDNKIKTVDEADRGKGIIVKSDIIGYDGLVTNKKDVAIVTFYADCVPIFFLDPINKVIAISHSGWRGTVREIARATVNRMIDEFGSNASDIETAIGPSIGNCCFEVGEEVFIEFKENLNWSESFCEKSAYGKWNINLQAIIKKTLTDMGVYENKICSSDICTKCNRETFFSHRGDQGKTGNLAAIMQLI
jgi:polyphenol oxidase